MRKFIFLFCILGCGSLSAQELYPYSEPASNMPSHSISLKATSMFMESVHKKGVAQHHVAEAMLGLNRKWMVHAGVSASDTRQSFGFDGAKAYIKYRFYSRDDVHKHLRSALFFSGAYNRNQLEHNELSLMDHSGVEGGLIVTQLWNKLALSGTAGWMEVINSKRSEPAYKDHYAFEAVNYSLSAGYLLLPFEYKNYDQTNLNIYLELLGSRNINFPEQYFVDLAPSLQFIFKSTGKLNLGYRFELSSDIYRMNRRSFMISYEHIFLNALKRSKVKSER